MREEKKLVIDLGTNTAVGWIWLNGYLIRKNGALGITRHIQSFAIGEGNLRPYWQMQLLVALKGDPLSQRWLARITAFPTEQDGYGLIEFVEEAGA